MLDILVVDTLGQLRSSARAAAVRIFAERNTHAFLSDTTSPAEWNTELETLARELGYRTTEMVEIQKHFTALIAAVASA